MILLEDEQRIKNYKLSVKKEKKKIAASQTVSRNVERDKIDIMQSKTSQNNQRLENVSTQNESRSLSKTAVKKKKRGLKDLFNELKCDEKKRLKMERIEEDELGFVADKEDIMPAQDA